MDSFEVENFRSLKHLKLEELTRVNLLVGKNNVGKTSILESIYATTSIFGRYWISIIESNRNSSSDRLDFKELFHAFDSTKKIILSTTYRSESPEVKIPKAKINVTLSIPDRHTLQSQELAYYDKKPSVPKNPYNLYSLIVNLNTSDFVSPASFELRRDINQLNDAYIFPIKEEDKEYLNNLPAFIAGPRNLAKLINTRNNLYSLNDELETLKVNKQDKHIVEILRNLDNRIIKLELSPSGQIYVDLGENFRTLLPLNLMGEGIQRLLSIVTAIASNSGGTVLIDEIDNGLHYSALRTLWKGILQVARDYNVQIFATTHSAEALRHLIWVLDGEEYASYRDDVAAYTLIRANDDTVRSYRYDYEQLDFAMEHDIEVRN